MSNIEQRNARRSSRFSIRWMLRAGKGKNGADGAFQIGFFEGPRERRNVNCAGIKHGNLESGNAVFPEAGEDGETGAPQL
jgi:hypothetical protein